MVHIGPPPDHVKPYLEIVIRQLRDLINVLCPCRHSPDFRSVVWAGKLHSFTATQAAIVRELWETYDTGCPEVGVAYLIENAGIDRDIDARIDMLFRGHPAWKTMIVPGTTKGTLRLSLPFDEVTEAPTGGGDAE